MAHNPVVLDTVARAETLDEIGVHVLAGKIHIAFVDDGPPVAVDVSKASMPGHLAESGRGLALARAVLDRLHYRRGFVNHWTLVSRQFG